MRQNTLNRSLVGLMIVVILLALSVSLVIPINAQDGSFATNTPAGESNAGQESAPALFATNTPEGMSSMPVEAMPEPTVSGPQALLSSYGDRFWIQTEFVQIVQEQIQQLSEPDEDTQLAINVLLYEMEQRFPGAPADAEQRAQMIEALLATPAGALDMRQIVRPFVQAQIDSDPAASLIDANGFEITLIPANLDGQGETDRIVNISYQDETGILYEEYLLATANDSGSYTLLPTTYDLPAVPFDGVQTVSVEYLTDVNSDTLDELVLRVQDGEVSDRFFIIGYRNGNAIDLVDPALQLRVGVGVSWPVEVENTSAPDLTLLEFQAESLYPDWRCLNQIEYTWVFERNLYRRTQDMNARFSNVDSLGCTLANTDLFSLPTGEAITTVESALLEYGFDAPSANRALMTLATLYVVSGRLDDARNTAQSVITADDDSTWESRQANALLRATSVSGNTVLDICEAIAIANEFPACDMNAVIGNYLEFVELTTDEDLEQQLNDVGLPVLEKVEVTEIGRAPRTTILFGYFGSEWWGFVDNRDGTYRYEPAEAPIEFPESSFPLPLVAAPQPAIDALLVDNSPARVLAILDNTVRENPDTPLSPAALYLQALSSEFTGDRSTARTLYYEIWQIYPDTIWAEIASEHLELR